MTATASQVRTYCILGCLAVLHSAVVLFLRFGVGPSFGIRLFLGWWLVVASSLFPWLLVLALHPGRSIRRFLISTIIAASLFIPCARLYSAGIYIYVYQWRAAYKVERLLTFNPKIILYSIDAEYRRLESKEGYRQLGPDEIVLPDDVFNDSGGSFVRMGDDDKPMIASIANSLGKTINSITEQDVRAGYGRDWQLLRKAPSAPTGSGAETATPPDEFDREPYRAPAVLGYAEITDRAEQHALITALARSALHTDGGALCHIPRHGLHIEVGTSKIDLSICFECQNVYVVSDNKTGPFAGVDSFAITDAPASVFNAMLTRHGVPVARVRPP